MKNMLRNCRHNISLICGLNFLNCQLVSLAPSAYKQFSDQTFDKLHRQKLICNTNTHLKHHQEPLETAMVRESILGVHLELFGRVLSLGHYAKLIENYYNLP
jgi:hypothetical protein